MKRISKCSRVLQASLLMSGPLVFSLFVFSPMAVSCSSSGTSGTNADTGQDGTSTDDLWASETGADLGLDSDVTEGDREGDGHNDSNAPQCFFDDPEGIVPEVTALYSLDPKGLLPFPSNLFSTADPDTRTGIRVDLAAAPATLIEGALGLVFDPAEMASAVKGRDGFAVYAPILIPFSGPLSEDLVDGRYGDFTGADSPVFLVQLDGPRESCHRIPMTVSLVDGQGAIQSLTILAARPLSPLQAATSYALVATRGLKGSQGGPVLGTESFLVSNGSQSGLLLPNCLQSLSSPYCPGDLVSAAVFTTAAVPHGLDALREWIRGPDSPPLDVIWALDDDGKVAAVEPGELEIWPSNVTSFPASSVVVSGSFLAPDLRRPDGDLQFVAGEAPLPSGSIRVPFRILLPRGDLPGPYPVVVMAHGMNGTKERIAYLAQRFGEEGLALAGIDAAGHGDLEGIGDLNSFEVPVLRGSFLQSQVNLLTFFKVLDQLVELDVLPSGQPDGVPDLDMSGGLGYVGESLGGLLGTAVCAVDSSVSAVVLNVTGGGLTGVLMHYVSAMIPPGREGDFLAFEALVQVILEVADPVAFAGRFRDALPRKSVLLQSVVDDDTIPNATTDALARALDVTQVCPCPYSTLGLETVAAPYTGNGLVYYPDAAHGFLLANSSNPAASDQARRQAAHFLRTALRNGAGEIVVPGE